MQSARAVGPLAVAQLLTLLLTGCSAERPLTARPLPEVSTRAPLRTPGARSPRLASYRIDARLDPKEHRVTATETLTWRHDGTLPVTELPLHLYMNAFKHETSVFLRESHGEHRSADMAEGKWGWIELSSIRVAGDPTELRPRARFGEDETTLTVPLPRPVAPGESVVLELAFVVQLPPVFARTGYDGDFYLVAQWFPKVGVLVSDASGAQAWHAETSHLASEYFADFGVYDVTLDLPDTHVVAATGVLTRADPLPGGRRKLTYRAEDVHDFVFMADPHMQVLHGTATTGDGGPDVDLYIYYPPERAAWAPLHLEAARRTIERFSRLFVPYPWPSMTVIDPPADAQAGAGGMEYPMVVTTVSGGPTFLGWLPIAEGTTVHEVGHNWFQGILASNEVDEAWLDEGMNEYADGVVLDEWRGADRSGLEALGFRAGYYAALVLGGGLAELGVPIAARSYDFPDWGAYGVATYGKTAAAMKTLEGIVGKERFLVAFGAYAKKWAFRHPTREDLFAALEASLGEDLRWFLVPAFLGTGEVDLRVGPITARPAHAPHGVFGEGDARKAVGKQEAKDDGWVSESVVVNIGTVPVAADIELRFEDGSSQRVRWEAAEMRALAWKRIEVTGKSKLAEITLDPDDKILLESERLQNSRRREPDSTAARKVAAEAGFVMQLLEQVVGL